MVTSRSCYSFRQELNSCVEITRWFSEPANTASLLFTMLSWAETLHCRRISGVIAFCSDTQCRADRKSKKHQQVHRCLDSGPGPGWEDDRVQPRSNPGPGPFPRCGLLTSAVAGAVFRHINCQQSREERHSRSNRSPA